MQELHAGLPLHSIIDTAIFQADTMVLSKISETLVFIGFKNLKGLEKAYDKISVYMSVTWLIYHYVTAN
jgi:hypothetical protein